MRLIDLITEMRLDEMRVHRDHQEDRLTAYPTGVRFKIHLPDPNIRGVGSEEANILVARAEYNRQIRNEIKEFRDLLALSEKHGGIKKLTQLVEDGTKFHQVKKAISTLGITK